MSQFNRATYALPKIYFKNNIISLSVCVSASHQRSGLLFIVIEKYIYITVPMYDQPSQPVSMSVDKKVSVQASQLVLASVEENVTPHHLLSAFTSVGENVTSQHSPSAFTSVG